MRIVPKLRPVVHLACLHGGCIHSRFYLHGRRFLGICKVICPPNCQDAAALVWARIVVDVCHAANGGRSHGLPTPLAESSTPAAESLQSVAEALRLLVTTGAKERNGGADGGSYSRSLLRHPAYQLQPRGKNNVSCRDVPLTTMLRSRILRPLQRG